MAPLGVATTNVIDRVMASVGSLDGVPTQFLPCQDVKNGGVLLALPALLAAGLLHNCAKYFHLPPGYYTLTNIFLLLGFMTLNRVKSIEELRRSAPGEWGKILGLDRCPAAKTLRRKIKHLTKGNSSEPWAVELAQGWMAAAEAEAGSIGGMLFLVDGHVRVYHGSQTKLPRHYVSRQRLCLRATTDYWVNQLDGQPLFKINQAVDPGLIKVLREQIVPQLEADVPNQPDEQALVAAPHLSRFTLVFDREGYSPALFKEMWEDKRIACQTYHKHPQEDWPTEEFSATEVVQANGNTAVWRLAERGTLLGSKKAEQIWVREIRKLSDKGHQCAIISTAYGASIEHISSRQFGRWSQENYFRYAGKEFSLNRLVDYQLEQMDDTTELVNPAYRKLDGQVRKAAAQLTGKQAEFGALNLKGAIKEGKVEEFLEKKMQLQAEIEVQSEQIKELKAKRKATKRKIPHGELPEGDQFDKLAVRSKHFIDTIKIIAYRAETVIAQILREKLNVHHREEARALAQQMFQTEANLQPDLENKTLTVEIHGLSEPKHDAILQHLCEELNGTETVYPDTDLHVVFKTVSP